MTRSTGAAAGVRVLLLHVCMRMDYSVEAKDRPPVRSLKAIGCLAVKIGGKVLNVFISSAR